MSEQWTSCTLSSMGTSEDELRRIREGPTADERAFLVRVSFSADDPAAVVERAREVLGCVVEHLESWPTEEWPQLLPAWFMERCAPERLADPSWDAASWLMQWQAMSQEERIAESEGPWTLSGWLYYFDPTDGEDGGRGMGTTAAGGGGTPEPASRERVGSRWPNRMALRNRVTSSERFGVNAVPANQPLSSSAD
jgi:hypothetical protein